MKLSVVAGDRVRLLEAEHGYGGYGLWVKLLQKVFGQGYYADWCGDRCKLFAADNRVEVELVEAVVQSALELGLFNRELYEKHSILTSRKLQLEFFDAAKRRKETVVQLDYLLAVVDDLPANVRLVDGDGRSVGLDQAGAEASEGGPGGNQNVDRSGQRRGENRRGKERKKDKFAHLRSYKAENGRSWVYPEEFEAIWAVYPRKRDGKKAGYDKWLKQVESGVKLEDLLEAAENYRDICIADGVEQRYIKQFGTFFGKGDHWMEVLADGDGAGCDGPGTAAGGFGGGARGGRVAAADLAVVRGLNAEQADLARKVLDAGDGSGLDAASGAG